MRVGFKAYLRNHLSSTHLYLIELFNTSYIIELLYNFECNPLLKRPAKSLNPCPCKKEELTSKLKSFKSKKLSQKPASPNFLLQNLQALKLSTRSHRRKATHLLIFTLQEPSHAKLSTVVCICDLSGMPM